MTKYCTNCGRATQDYTKDICQRCEQANALEEVKRPAGKPVTPDSPAEDFTDKRTPSGRKK
jgi:hypothetical protein